MAIYSKEFMELQQRAIEALNRIRSTDDAEVIKESRNKYSFKIDVEPFTEEAFTEKAEIDASYFSVLLKNVPDDDKDIVVETIDNIYEIARAIYEDLGIKPKAFCESEFEGLVARESKEDKAKKIIVEYINKSFYDLSPAERDRRYKDKVLQISESYVIEHSVEPEKAVELAQKKIILESLIRKIVFPGSVKARIDEVIQESTDDMFDNSNLIKLYEAFEEKVSKLALALSSVI